MQNTSKMLDHNVLVRKAQGIETAGSLNIYSVIKQERLQRTTGSC